MPFSIIRGDITKVKADVLVNTANPNPVVGGGTDSAIYRAAGREELLAERRKVGVIAPGEAVATSAFALPARYVIHTVGPFWVDGRQGERDVLRACYRNSLRLAQELGAESIAFPLIATGVYRFPKEEALSIALEEIGRFLLTHEMLVTLAVLDPASFAVSREVLGEIEEFILEQQARVLLEREYAEDISAERRGGNFFRREHSAAGVFPRAEKPREKRYESPAPAMGSLSEAVSSSSLPAMEGKSLEEILKTPGETFQQRLFSLIDQSGMDDVTVYKRANIDRKLFSKIRCRPDYQPKKKTAVAFAIALKLDLPTTIDLLSRAEIAFSPSSTFDLIITYFVTHGIYDIYQINAALFDYGQPILGGDVS